MASPNKNKELNLEDVRAYAEHKAGAIRRPYGKFLDRMEKRMTGKVARRLKQQRKYVVDEMASLPFFDNAKGVKRFETKTMYDDIDNFVDGIPYNTELVDDIVAVARPSYRKGVDRGITELDLGQYGITFDLVNDEAVRYLEDIKVLNLSDFKGSISRQTKDKIRKILIESAETGRSYTETAKLIEEQGEAGVFSRSRAELIAVNQVGHAFGQGNMDIVDGFISETGSIVQKAWQTVGDDRVTPECQENQDIGWIGFNEAFPSGDEQAPRASNPRCRCVTTFQVVDTQGNPI